MVKRSPSWTTPGAETLSTSASGPLRAGQRHDVHLDPARLQQARLARRRCRWSPGRPRAARRAADSRPAAGRRARRSPAARSVPSVGEAACPRAAAGRRRRDLVESPCSTLRGARGADHGERVVGLFGAERLAAESRPRCGCASWTLAETSATKTVAWRSTAWGQPTPSSASDQQRRRSTAAARAPAARAASRRAELPPRAGRLRSPAAPGRRPPGLPRSRAAL